MLEGSIYLGKCCSRRCTNTSVTGSGKSRWTVATYGTNRETIGTQAVDINALRDSQRGLIASLCAGIEDRVSECHMLFLAGVPANITAATELEQ